MLSARRYLFMFETADYRSLLSCACGTTSVLACVAVLWTLSGGFLHEKVNPARIIATKRAADSLRG